MDENENMSKKRKDAEEEDDEAEEEDQEEGAGDDNSSANVEGLLCFTSLQTVLAMELCRGEMRAPTAIGGEENTSTSASNSNVYSDTWPLMPLAFLKLIVVAAAWFCEEQEDQEEDGREWWKLPRRGSEWRRLNRAAPHLDASARDALFRRKYSMSYACFVYVVEELRPFIQSDCGFFVRAPLEVDRAVALVIFRLAHGLSARQVAEKYNVGASTVGKYTLIVTAALSDAAKLYSRYVAIPTGDRLSRIASAFQQMTNLPNMCGAIDGTHIKLYFKPARHSAAAPSTSSSCRPAYKFHSIFLQAVCDTNKVFWDVSCKQSTALHQKIRDGVALQEPVISMGGAGVPVKPFMVARDGYPIEPFCITPFGSEEGLRKAFDDQLLKGFSCIEEGFRILKTRWKILRCMNVHLIHASQLAVACCVLHNICQLWGEPDPQEIQGDSHPSGNRSMPVLYRPDQESRIAGEEIREALFRDWVRRSLEGSSLPK